MLFAKTYKIQMLYSGFVAFKNHYYFNYFIIDIKTKLFHFAIGCSIQ